VIANSLLTKSAAILLLASPWSAAREGWNMDYDTAKVLAAETDRDLLLEFTGSEWCGYCKVMAREVFTVPEFIAAASEDFVLVMLDFPRDPERIPQKNKELSEQYRVPGYPIVFLCDAQGRPYARTGFREGGAVPYLEHLNELRNARNEREAALQAVVEAGGLPKAEALIALLQGTQLDAALLTAFYQDELEQIKANDPEDETGFYKKWNIQEKIREFGTKVNALASESDYEGMLPLVDEILRADGLESSEVQRIMMARVSALSRLKRFDEALATAEEAIAIDPESTFINRLEATKQRVIRSRDAAAAEQPGEEE